MLEDYRRVTVERKGEQELFSLAQVHSAISKVRAIDVRETVRVGSDIEFKAYYGGHVIGAAMFYVSVKGSSVLYTGDYNMTSDRHLGAAQVDRLEPHVLITESTYATTVRGARRAREREFLTAVHECLQGGGKVLIPIFALGRAQELAILLDEYWERFRLSFPIYFSAGLTAQANVYYKMLLGWTNESVRASFAARNTFDFHHVAPFDRSIIDAPGPCVLFATPGMLSGGLSLEVFKKWAPSEKNLIIMPGFCVSGTVGHKLMMGRHSVDLGGSSNNNSHNGGGKGSSHLDIKAKVQQLSFSAHTDAKGIFDLIRHVKPQSVVLVHGERPKMATLRKRITERLGLRCEDPPNNAVLHFPTHPPPGG
eukprot:jgi/Mesen1/1011/ME000121S00093